MRKERRIEATLLRRDHHPAGRLVPAGRLAVLRIVLRHEVERHAEILAPAVELVREGVTNLRCLDRAPHGSEGPWTTFARMDILRSPKHLTGPDLGVASLTYRAYHEAKFGTAHWEKLHKIDRVEWARYLMWVRETAGVPVENGVAVRTVELVPGAVRISTEGGMIHARKAVLAMGREGSGALRC